METPDNKLWLSQIHVIKEHLVIFVFLWLSFFFTDCAKTMCLFVGKSVLMDKKHAKNKKKAKLPKQTLITVSKAFNYEGEVRNTYVCACVCQGSVGGLKL